MIAEPTDGSIHIDIKRSKREFILSIAIYTASIFSLALTRPSNSILLLYTSAMIFCLALSLLPVFVTLTGIIVDKEGLKIKLKNSSGQKTMNCVDWQDVRSVELVTQPVGTRHLLVFKLTEERKERILTEVHLLRRWWLRLRFRLSANELIWRPAQFDIQPEDFATLLQNYHSRYRLPFQLDESHL
ncbi:MAG: hypothetical protein AAF267_22480 [Deinococcota bacterium]